MKQSRKTYTAPELNKRVVEILDTIKSKFTGKNESYGDPANGFFNFDETALEFRELFGEDEINARFQVAMVLFHKHFVTLKKNGVHDKEFKDRMGDWIAYGALMMAMGELVEEPEKPESPIDLQNMTRDEAKRALQEGLCTAVRNKNWAAPKAYSFYANGEFWYRETPSHIKEKVFGAFGHLNGYYAYTPEPTVNYRDMNTEEAKKALLDGKVDKIYCTMWGKQFTGDFICRGTEPHSFRVVWGKNEGSITADGLLADKKAFNWAEGVCP